MRDIVLEDLEQKLSKYKNKLEGLNKLLTEYNLSAFQTKSLHSIKRRLENLINSEENTKKQLSFFSNLTIVLLLLYIVNLLMPFKWIINLSLSIAFSEILSRVEIRFPNKSAIQKAISHLSDINIVINNRNAMKNAIDIEFREVENSRIETKKYDLNYFNELNEVLISKIMALPPNETLYIITTKKSTKNIS